VLLPALATIAISLPLLAPSYKYLGVLADLEGSRFVYMFTLGASVGLALLLFPKHRLGRAAAIAVVVAELGVLAFNNGAWRMASKIVTHVRDEYSAKIGRYGELPEIWNLPDNYYGAYVLRNGKECFLRAPFNLETTRRDDSDAAFVRYLPPRRSLEICRPGAEVREFGVAQRARWSIHDLSPLVVDGDVLRARSVGQDAFLEKGIEAFRVGGIEVKMKVSAGARGRIFWLTDGDRALGENDHFSEFALKLGEAAVYRIPVCSERPVTHIRLNPTDARDAEVEIGYVKLISASAPQAHRNF
jgi:hypothetical protein